MGRHRRGRHRLRTKPVWPRVVVGIICVAALSSSAVIVNERRATPRPVDSPVTTPTSIETAAPQPDASSAPEPRPAETVEIAPEVLPSPATETTVAAPTSAAPEPVPTPTLASPPPQPEPEAAAEPEPEPTTYPTTGFGGVKPHVAVVGHLIKLLFGVTTSGVGHRSRASDHPLGYALDFIIGSDRKKGDAIAACVLSHEDSWHVNYVIWRQRINHGSGWEAMEDRGSVTENHYDHVHVSFDHGKLALPLALTC